MGVLIAAFAGINGPSYLTGDKITSAKPITFLWVETFPLGFYAPSLLPLLIAFVVSTVESIGDITATAEASQLSIEVCGERFDHFQLGLPLALDAHSAHTIMVIMYILQLLRC